MGRPLFSQNYTIVRSEQHKSIHCEKWSVWNNFDPDSDEFFENDPVYEAFIVLDDDPSTPDIVLDDDDDDGTRSPASSENSTASDRRSPMAVGSDDDPIQLFADALPADYWGQAIPLPLPSQIPAPPAHPPSSADILYTTAPPGTDAQSQSPRTFRHRSATITILPPLRQSHQNQNQNQIDTFPRTSTITPIPIPPSSRTRVGPPSTPSPPQSAFFPATPPSQIITPSPAPSVSPRILTWSSRAAAASTSATPTPSSPSGGGPLTNPNARMSLAHIAPSIRVRDVFI